MELIYAALLLHKSGKEINSESLNKVMDAVGVKIDDAKIKALVAALEGVNIDQAIKEAVAVGTTSVIGESKKEESSEKKEENKEKEEKKDEAKSAAGLGALFG